MFYYECKKGLNPARGYLQLPGTLMEFNEFEKSGLNKWNYILREYNPSDIVERFGLKYHKDYANKIRVVEVDADGVILNIHQHLNAYVADLMSDFDGDEHIESWGMQELNNYHPDLKGRCLKLFSDEGFMTSIKPFDKGVMSLRYLDYLQRYYSHLLIVVNTHCYKSDLSAKREVWLSECFKEWGVGIPIITCSGPEKTMLDSTYVIDDNADNLKNSTADYKFLVKRGHNRYAQESDLGSSVKSMLGLQLWDYVPYIADIEKDFRRSKIYDT